MFYKTFYLKKIRKNKKLLKKLIKRKKKKKQNIFLNIRYN